MGILIGNSCLLVFGFVILLVVVLLMVFQVSGYSSSSYYLRPNLRMAKPFAQVGTH